MSDQLNERKPLVAKSTAHYRGLFITEAPDGGCTFFIGEQQYDFISLAEATSCIDAIYARTLAAAENKSLPTT